MNILRVRQAAAREDRIAFKLSGRLATSAPAPTLRAHACALTRERASERTGARGARAASDASGKREQSEVHRKGAEYGHLSLFSSFGH